MENDSIWSQYALKFKETHENITMATNKRGLNISWLTRWKNVGKSAHQDSHKTIQRENLAWRGNLTPPPNSPLCYVSLPFDGGWPSRERGWQSRLGHKFCRRNKLCSHRLSLNLVYLLLLELVSAKSTKTWVHSRSEFRNNCSGRINLASPGFCCCEIYLDHFTSGTKGKIP